MTTKKTIPPTRNKSLSLYPLSMDEIIEGMLQTPPMPKQKKQVVKATRQRKKLPNK